MNSPRSRVLDLVLAHRLAPGAPGDDVESPSLVAALDDVPVPLEAAAVRVGLALTF